MLSKLLKYEFQATGRTMLPLYAATAALAVLANLSIRLMDTTDSTALLLLFSLVVIAFGVSIVVVLVLTGLVMVLRFHRSLLKDQGYLMHTLPVTVHGQLWSKLIVSLVWVLATGLLIFLLLSLSALFQSGTRLWEVFASFPDWGELRDMLLAEGVEPGQLTLLLAELLCGGILAFLTTCLHFYAAMSLGHMFSRNKVLMSVLFFVGFSFLFRFFQMGAVYLWNGQLAGGGFAVNISTAAEGLSEGIRAFVRILLTQLVQGALLYLAAALGLKKGLNLA